MKDLDYWADAVSDLLRETNHNDLDYDVLNLTEALEEYGPTIHSREEFEEFIEDYKF